MSSDSRRHLTEDPFPALLVSYYSFVYIYAAVFTRGALSEWLIQSEELKNYTNTSNSAILYTAIFRVLPRTHDPIIGQMIACFFFAC